MHNLPAGSFTVLQRVPLVLQRQRENWLLGLLGRAVDMLLRFAPRSPPGSSYNSKHMDTQVILVKFSGPPEANLQSHEYGKRTCRELGIQGQEGE